MKKILSLLLAVVLTLSLAACSSGPALLGKYETTIDLTETIASWFDEDYAGQIVDAEALGMSLATYMDPFEITVNLEFKEDGTYLQTFDPASVEAAAEALKPALYIYAEDIAREYTISFTGSVFAVETTEDLERILGTSWEEYYNTNLRAVMESTIVQCLDTYVETLTGDDVTVEANFKAKNGKLYTTSDLSETINKDSYETYEIDGDNVTITGSVNAEENEYLPYPYTLTKISE